MSYQVESAVKTLKGGFVYPTEPGLKPVREGNVIVVLDFGTFYPSLLVAFNISKELMHLRPEERLKRPLGLTPKLCQKHLKLRYYYDDLLDENLKKYGPDSIEYKLTKLNRNVTKFRVNAIFGYGLYRKSRVYDYIGMSIMLQYAKEFLWYIESKAKERGWILTAGDTDSIILELPLEEVDEAEVFIQECIKLKCIEWGVDPKYIKIKIDRVADKAIFVSKKGEKRGAKKRYILRVVREKDKWLERPYYDYKGVEVVRGDQSTITKNVQIELIEAIFDDKVGEFIENVKKLIKKIEGGEFDLDEISIALNLQKDLSEYKTHRRHLLP